MNGDPLAAKIRRILRDFTSPTRGGQFWSDEEIRLALNAAQDIFINFCLNNDLYYLLDRLISVVQVPISTDNPITVPQDYLHFASAVVGKESGQDIDRVAQIHIGGDADKYMWVVHDSCNIIADEIHFMAAGVWGIGQLFYYKRPSFIGLTSLGDDTNPDFNDVDFEDSIYDDVICYHAALLLGIKETRNKRNVLYDRTFMNKVLTVPQNIENYADIETPSVKYDEVIKKMQGQ